MIIFYMQIHSHFQKYYKERVNDVTVLMIVVIIWESIQIGWDDPQRFVGRVFAVTFFGFVIGEIFRFFWKRSHFSKK